MDDQICPQRQRALENRRTEAVVHSATKYLDGQGRCVGGAVVGDAEKVGKDVFGVLRTAGPSMSPFNAWVFLKGLETLKLRMRAHCENAAQIAAWLETRAQVERVFYPGLASHPQHALARTQQRGYGGIVSFELSGGRAEALANLTFVQSQAGDISYAKKNYHQALGIDPTLAVAANGLYEIHNAFPDHDSMLIKPFRERADAHPERLVTKDGSADDIDQLIRAISIKPGNRSSSLKADHVVPASYQAPIDRRLPIAERDFEEPNLQKSQSHPVGISSAPQRAENIKAKRIPTQSGSSSRRAESSVRSSDSSNR